MVRTVPRRSVGKCPDMGATRSTRGWSPATSFRKRSKVPNGVRSTTSSLTATSRPSTRTRSMPYGGHSWVSPVRATISKPAAALSSHGSGPAHQNDWRIMDAVRPAIVRTGAMTSV